PGIRACGRPLPADSGRVWPACRASQPEAASSQLVTAPAGQADGPPSSAGDARGGMWGRGAGRARSMDHGRGTRAQLGRGGEVRGVTPAYRDWQGRKIQVSDETLHAVLAVLGSAPLPARPGAGRLAAPLAAPWHPGDHPAAPPVPRFGWGFTAQL